MNEERIYNQALLARLDQYLQAGHSQAEAAKQLGVTAGLLSAYRSQKYQGSIQNVEAKLSEFFRHTDEAAAAQAKAEPYKPAESYVPTSISQDVYNTIQYCQIERGMVILHGDAGIGKTKGAQKYVSDNPATAIYIQASPTFGSLGSFLKILARTLGIAETKSKLDLVLNIRDKLDGTNRVLIVDEAQHLKLQALEEIRTLSDPNMITGKPGIGIVLIGNSEVYDRMLGRQEARFAQLFSRIRMNRLYLTGNITKQDVEKLFPALRTAGNEKQMDFLLGVSKSKWGIRGAVNVYENAINGEDLSYKGLVTQARTMGIGMIA